AFRDEGERPYYAYSLLTVDKRSGMILGQELLPPLPSLLDMYSQIPLKVVYLLSQIGSRPKEIRVRSPILYQLLATLEKELGFKLKSTNQLALLDSVKEDLFRFLMR
ncbi:MAG: hypothetical protein DPW09_11425, partial [Anaerolineae bacterium]|nr:hypothetical protein [Anaerolineae bacterium]